jgi:hypothetical protein
MRTFFVALLVGAAAFAAGVWYTREYVPAPIETPITPTTTPITPVETPKATYINASADKIVVTSPLPGATVGNTFSITGRARGGWYFEASFPIQVLSATSTLLKEMPVQAQGDWMTANFVPFATTTIAVPAWYKGPATLVLKNDNPSGLPENDASISIPIVIQ